MPRSSWTATTMFAVGTTSLALASFVLWNEKKKNRRDQERNKDRIDFALPDWASKDFDLYSRRTYESDEDCMNLAIELSARNVAEGTGGPFGCAIFERDAKSTALRLFTIGVNRVVALNNSTLHAELVAVQLAQKRKDHFTLKVGGGLTTYELYTSTSPCCQCLGGCFWSGISRLVCGATKEDAEAIGFDEGPVFEESYDHLRKNGIAVKLGVLREAAAEVLNNYAKAGVIIYNA